MFDRMLKRFSTSAVLVAALAPAANAQDGVSLVLAQCGASPAACGTIVQQYLGTLPAASPAQLTELGFLASELEKMGVQMSTSERSGVAEAVKNVAETVKEQDAALSEEIEVAAGRLSSSTSEEARSSRSQDDNEDANTRDNSAIRSAVAAGPVQSADDLLDVSPPASPN